MILTCTECATSYFVDDDKIPPQGRVVKCANCGTRWTAKLEPELELTASPEEGAVGVEPQSALIEPKPVSA
ncbi:MAG: zinc-ribbon domain-containing protein, partial [Phenylobacterium sp.]|uniref:MJ0042-type zinc finger domain-containing protein n=1 Tax=Phenylobacterium sp. TaxID=1871053 RepID=UPI0027332C70